MANSTKLDMSQISSLHCDQLASAEMWQYWRDHFSHPPLFNDLGCFRTGPNPMDIHNFMFPPFSGNGEATAILYLNRQHPALCDVQVGYTWYPDRVRRRTKFEGLDVETVTRALPDEPGALIRLTLLNPSSEKRSVEVGIKLAGRLKYTIDEWAGIAPMIGVMDEHKESWSFEKQLGAMCFSSAPKAFSYQGTSPPPDRVEGKTFMYQVELGPGERWTLNFVAALGESEEIARQRYIKHINGFDQSCELVLRKWNDRIQKAFIPGNDLYSGHLPALITENEDLLRLYLMTTLGCLVLRRNNPISSYGTAYVTLSPNYWTTASFLWDMMIAAPFYALLDPEVMRKHIEVWLGVDIKNYLATDYVTGKPLGVWYAVNSSAIVRLSYNYLRFTGNFNWLNHQVNGRPIIDHLQEHALEWHNLDKHGHGLADCGGVANLLECVSTYTHEVAAFNAMWVAALRQVAELRRLRGEHSIAEKLENDASQLLRNVMTLYAEGKGYWRCRQPDGSFNDVHHIYDFIAVLESIADDLPKNVQQEMATYFFENHQTENWMCALAHWDDDAHRAWRVDLQWTGAYPSLPAQVINGLFKIGYADKAFEWLLRIAPVAYQGPLGQAHWVHPLYPSFKGGAWKCSYILGFMADWTVAANGAYPAMVIESLFGVNATLDKGLKFKGVAPQLDKGASLRNLRYQGKNYHIDRNGITLAE
ncbi:hypothetical protein J7M23_02780 [Candidatus Sumerlaeota bacterium]|nr:hypothetical protein [Candidatus Sumerlaeota bacterium]